MFLYTKPGLCALYYVKATSFDKRVYYNHFIAVMYPKYNYIVGPLLFLRAVKQRIISKVLLGFVYLLTVELK